MGQRRATVSDVELGDLVAEESPRVGRVVAHGESWFEVAWADDGKPWITRHGQASLDAGRLIITDTKSSL